MTRSIVDSICIVVLGLVALAALVPGLITQGDPTAISPSEAFLAPSWQHLFGTDESGRDVFTRVVHGAAPSMAIGLSATVIGLGLGLVLGAVSGLGPHWLDFGASRVIEVLFAFPALLLALLFIMFTGPGVVTSAVAVGLATAPGYARLIRSQFLSIRESAYVESAIVLGRSWPTIFRQTLVPGVVRNLFVLATLGVAQSVVWASSLSFLGLGVPPPASEWGALLNSGRVYIDLAWWLTFFPGLAIVAVAASATVLGRSFNRRVRAT